MDSIIQCNPKNKLQEILAKYMGNSAPVPTYHCIPSNEGFYCDLNVTLTVSGITKSWNSRTLKPFARKKDAEINAASEINIDEIRTFLSEKDDLKEVSVDDSLPSPPPSMFQTFVNHKGLLIEQISKTMPPCLPPQFETTPASSSFTSTVVVKQLGCGGSPNKLILSVTGPPCGTKKEAEQAAAQKVLAKYSFKEQPNKFLSLVAPTSVPPTYDPDMDPSGQGDFLTKDDGSAINNNNYTAGNKSSTSDTMRPEKTLVAGQKEVLQPAQFGDRSITNNSTGSSTSATEIVDLSNISEAYMRGNDKANVLQEVVETTQVPLLNSENNNDGVIDTAMVMHPTEQHCSADAKNTHCGAVGTTPASITSTNIMEQTVAHDDNCSALSVSYPTTSYKIDIVPSMKAVNCAIDETEQEKVDSAGQEKPSLCEGELQISTTVNSTGCSSSSAVDMPVQNFSADESATPNNSVAVPVPIAYKGREVLEEDMQGIDEESTAMGINCAIKQIDHLEVQQEEEAVVPQKSGSIPAEKPPSSATEYNDLTVDTAGQRATAEDENTQCSSVTAASTPTIPPCKTGTIFSTKDIPQVNAKGKLLESWRASKTSNSPPSFVTSAISPFICTIFIVLKEGSQPIYIKSDPFSSKKAAEKHAAELALNDPRVQAAFNLKPHSLVTQNIGPPTTNSTMEGSLPDGHVTATKEVSNGTPLSLQTLTVKNPISTSDLLHSIPPPATPVYDATVNFKGLLIERVARTMPLCLLPEFVTPALIAPFTSTVVVKQLGCGGSPNKLIVSVTGPPCGTKKEAEQAAAHVVLAKCTFHEQPNNKLCLVVRTSVPATPSSTTPDLKPSGQGDCGTGEDIAGKSITKVDVGNERKDIHCTIIETEQEVPTVDQDQDELLSQEQPVLRAETTIMNCCDSVNSTPNLVIDTTRQVYSAEEDTTQCSSVTAPEAIDYTASGVLDVRSTTMSNNCTTYVLRNDTSNVPQETIVIHRETSLISAENTPSSDNLKDVDCVVGTTDVVVDSIVKDCSAQEEDNQCSSIPVITVPITAHVSDKPVESIASTPLSSVSASTSTKSVFPADGTYKSQLFESVKKLVPPCLPPQFTTTASTPFMCTITLSRRDSSNDTTTVLLEVVGQGCTRKKDAEHAAAQAVLENPVFLALQNCHYSSPQSTDDSCDADYSATNGDVCCVGCNGRIGDIASFFFYDKSETEVQFALKPEVANLVLGTAIQDSIALHLPKVCLVDQNLDQNCSFPKKRLTCVQCQKELGVYMKTGPKDAPLSSFGVEKLSLLGSTFSSRDRWREVAKDPKFFSIEHRTEDSFFHGSSSGNSIRAMRPHNNTPIKFPLMEGDSYLESPDFQVDDLLSADCTKEPRPEQLRALHLALQAHMIVVFPTGFGKTFVAAMFMHRFCLLNPSKVVVMVVDRVPLVEQQSRAILLDTDLLVCPLSGENSTSYMVRELLSGKYDALVITAGALCNYLKRDELRMSDFSAIVLDECHHVTGDHLYGRLLKLVSHCPDHLRPRVLGLTASPFNAKTEGKATTKLSNLRNSFLDAEVYRPNIAEQSSQGIERHPVSLTPQQLEEQINLVKELQTHFNSLIDIYQLFYPELLKETGSDSIDVSNRSHWSRIVNLAAEAHLNSIPEAQKKTANAVADRVRDLVRALEDNYLMGPAFVTLDGRTPDAVIASAAATGLSNQLLTLCAIVDKYGEQSSTLVFVDTRYTAEVLTNYLIARFPALNCSKVIGQGGVDGMRWRGNTGQDALLQAFRSGDTKLIVCTSVLEEGLDVKGCDLVIRFGGAPSLIQVVQSKGRARAKNGRLLLICTREEERHFDKLMHEEQFIDAALAGCAPLVTHTGNYIEEVLQGLVERRRDRAVDVTTDSEVNWEDYGIEGSDDPDFNTQLRRNCVDQNGEMGISSYGLQLIVCSGNECTEKKLLQVLRAQAGIIQSVERANFTRRGAHLAVSDDRLIDEADSLAVVSVKSFQKSFLFNLCAMWDFQVGDIPVYLVPPVRIRLKSQTEEDDEADIASQLNRSVDGVISVAVGHFLDRQKFLHMYDLGSDAMSKYDNLAAEGGKNCRNLVLASVGAPDESIKGVEVILSRSILGNSVVASADRTDKTVTIYFSMQSVPAMYRQTAALQCGESREEQSLKRHSQNRVFCRPSTASTVPDQAERDLHHLSLCPVLAVTFPAKKWKRLVRLLGDPDVLGLNLLVTRVAVTPYPQEQADRLVVPVDTGATLPSSDELAVARRRRQWSLSTLVSDVHCLPLNPVVLDKIQDDISEMACSDDITALQAVTSALQQLHARLQQGCQWVDPVELFRDYLSRASTHITNSEWGAFEDDDKEYVMAERAIATPSRVQVLPAVRTKTNRLIRMLGGRWGLVYVKFRDEQGQGIFNDKVYTERFQHLLVHGIDICDRHYQYLLCSASQLREQTAVFIQGSREDVEKIRQRIIPDRSCFRGDIIKYISRLGLFCTADTDTMEVLSDEVLTIEPDTHTLPASQGSKQVMLTDGAGLMTPDLMRRSQSDFYKQHGYYAPLIQIRALGCKGTLLCYPDLPRTHPGKDVVFRKSMHKFDTACQRSLCVVKVAEHYPLTLNREIINLLCALRDKADFRKRTWSPHETFMALQDEELNKLGQMLVDPSSALERLRPFYAEKDLHQLTQGGLSVLTEPHLWSLLQLLYYNDSRALRRKTHIPVMHAALVMGAPDPTGLLRDGEVFLCVHRPRHLYQGCFTEGIYSLGPGAATLVRVDQSEDDDMTGKGFETFVVTGKVLIYRNPCLDPGSVRIVTAVDHRELRFWKNALLLPASDIHCQRSLSAECSGGDLDGDTFGTIWHPALVPPDELAFDAVDFDEIMAEAKSKMPSNVSTNSREDEHELIAGFVARTMCNASLGRIANLHLAVCDQLHGKGAGHPLARKLAEAQSLAVDYPKTGVPPTVPPEAKRMVRAKGYPHFMENPNKEEYVSTETLGTLYNISSSVACTVEFAGRSLEFVKEAAFAVEGMEQYRDEAEEVYEEFAAEVRRVMLRFKLSDEAEMVLGLPYNWSDEFALDHTAAADCLTASWRALRDKYKRLFYSNLPDADPNTARQKAAAWYQVAYASNDSFHSFAWIVISELAALRQASVRATSGLQSLSIWTVHDAVAGKIGGSAMQLWMQEKDQLLQGLTLKRSLFERVKKAILSSPSLQHEAGVTVELYGSVSLLQCNQQSDIDVSVVLPSQQQSLFVLQNYIEPAVDDIALTKRTISNAEVPLVHIKIEDGFEGTDVDITAQHSDGVHKSQLIRWLYTQNPWYVVLLSSLIQWARCCGLLRGFVADKTRALLNSGQFQALVVRFLLQKHKHGIDLAAGATVRDDILLRGLRTSVRSSIELGSLLLEFFMHYSRCSEVMHFEWPVPSKSKHIIVEDAIEEVSACCRRALHCLAVSRNWQYLLEHSRNFERARTRMEQELNEQLSGIIMPNKDFIAIELAVRSKACVQILQSPDYKSRLVVVGTGRPQQIQVLRSELRRVIYSGRIKSFGAVRSLSSAFFMESSSFIYAMGAETQAAKLQYMPIYIDRMLKRSQYDACETATLSLPIMSRCQDDSWKVAFKAALLAKVHEQLGQISQVKSDQQLIFSVHLGKFLLINAKQIFERNRNSMSSAEVATAMDNAKGNTKVEQYGTTSATATPPPQQSGSGERKERTTPRPPVHSAPSSTVKKNISTTFVSSIPLLSAEADIHKSTSYPGDCAASLAATELKIENILTSSLGYTKFQPSDAEPLSDSAQATISLKQSTLQLPRSNWLVSLELSPKMQAHVDLDAQNCVLDVSNRMLTCVNGTLVSAAASADTTETSTEHHRYHFNDHDLRFKIGLLHSLPQDSSIYTELCRDGVSPIELVYGADGTDHHNCHVSVNSTLPSQYAADSLPGTVQIRPAEHIKNPQLITFVRHVTQRRAFLCPDWDASPSPTAAKKVKVMAVFAAGEHYDGSYLNQIHPFADISLEIDVSELNEYINGGSLQNTTIMTENASFEDEESVLTTTETCSVSTALDLEAYLNAACDEVLRVSETIKHQWCQ